MFLLPLDDVLIPSKNLTRARTGWWSSKLNCKQHRRARTAGSAPSWEVYTWSNERAPSHRFVSIERWCRWNGKSFSQTHLQASASDASDHTPLLLQTNFGILRKPRFHFECFWPKLDGFQEELTRGWRCCDTTLVRTTD